MTLLVFMIDGHNYAIESSYVRKVVRMVEITPLPGGPDAILGVIDVQGDIAPVIDLRRCLGMNNRELNICDQLIIVHAEGRCFALPVDETEGVIDCSEETVTPASGIVSDAIYVCGVAKRAEGMVLIYSIEKLLSVATEALTTLEPEQLTGGQNA